MVSTQTDFLAIAQEKADKERQVSLDSVFGASDHKIVGRLYICLSIFVLLSSLVLAVVTTFELVDFASLDFVKDQDQLFQLSSLTRESLLFGGLIPLLVGLGIYLVPLQVGVNNLVFSRGAMASFWTWFLGFLLFVAAFLFNGGPGGGREDFVVLWLISLAMMIGALIWAMVCIATTLIGARAQGMTLDKAPYTSWSFLVFSVIGSISLPITLAEILLSIFRVRYGQLPLGSSEELALVIAPLLSAPLIFWLVIPALGFVVDIIGVHSGKPVVFQKSIMLLLGFFGAMTFLSGLSAFASLRTFENNAMLTVCLGAALLAVFALFALSGRSVAKGKRSTSAPFAGIPLVAILILSALLLAVVDSLTAALRSIAFFDADFLDLPALSLRSLSDTDLSPNKGSVFFGSVLALVVGAVIVSAYIALHHWSVKFWGRQLKSSFGHLGLLLAFGGSLAWSGSQVVSALLGEDADRLSALLQSQSGEGQGSIARIVDLVGVAGVAALVAAVSIVLLDLVSLITTKQTGSASSGWKGLTLEWGTASPPLPDNFPILPVVTSASPLSNGDVFARETNETMPVLENSENVKALTAGGEH